jgi:hypothetical protein
LPRANSSTDTQPSLGGSKNQSAAVRALPENLFIILNS